MWPFNKKPAQPESATTRSAGFFSTDAIPAGMGARTTVTRDTILANAIKNTFQAAVPRVAGPDGVAMDDNDGAGTYAYAKALLGRRNYGVSDSQVAWYGSQNFIGYQLCAMFAQHWLVDKACTMPARDAVRQGFNIVVTDGSTVHKDTLAEIARLDKIYRLKPNLIEFVRQGRVFGIRHALFVVDSTDPEYYEKPFNPDGITPGSYRGISQIDPYWITPILDQPSAADPAAIDFYEPTWWNVTGKKIHKSHFVIYRTNEVADILKPTYQYGGVSVPQKIYERVYASERTANEAPMLAMSKRLTILHANLEEAFGDPDRFEERLQLAASLRDNYGYRVIGTDEQIEQFDTALADLDNVIMTQYQIVAAIAEVPSTKLLGTQPKGFNSNGEYEEDSYHESLESIQEHDMARMVNRHHLCLIRSDIKGKPFAVDVEFNPLDSPSASELATINKTKADTGNVLVASGAIDPQEERDRVAADPTSGYTGLEGPAPDPVEDDEENTDNTDE